MELYSLGNRYQPDDVPLSRIEEIKEDAAPSILVRLYNSGKLDEMMFDARNAVRYLNRRLGYVCRVCKGVYKYDEGGSHDEYDEFYNYFSFRGLYQTMPDKKQKRYDSQEQLCNSLCTECHTFIFRNADRHIRSGVDDKNAISLALSKLMRTKKFRDKIRDNRTSETEEYLSYWGQEKPIICEGNNSTLKDCKPKLGKLFLDTQKTLKLNCLTDQKIRKLKTKGRYRDGLGLYLVVTQSGSKQWVLRITVNGKRKDIGLGGYPTVSLSKARKKALSMRRMAEDGIDPVISKARK